MKSSKILAGILSVTLLSLATTTALAGNLADLKLNNAIEIQKAIPISAPEKAVHDFSFGSFTGVVKEITERVGINNFKYLSVKAEDGKEAKIIITDNTYILDNQEIKVGLIVTGYYDANAPMKAIYPSQYPAEVLVVENQEQIVKVDVFNNNLISSDNMLKLNLSDKTETVLPDGTIYYGELADQKLAAVYTSSTKSIPAQTEPNKIVVLLDKEEYSSNNPRNEEKPAPQNTTSKDIIVNKQIIKDLTAFTNANGKVMVPLRVIAKNLGYEVHWDGQLQKVMLNKVISLTIGQNSYIDMQNIPITLETSPIVVSETTYVPLSFFTEVAGVGNAYVTESQIIIEK